MHYTITKQRTVQYKGDYMKKILVFLGALLGSCLSLAEPALHKEINLEPIDKIVINAQIELKIVKSNEYKAEISIRQASTKYLRLEIIDKEEKKQLFITEQYPTKPNKTEKVTLAKVTLYLPTIESVHLKKAHSLTTKELTLDNLYISAAHRAVININDSNIKKLHATLKSYAQLIIKNSQFDKLSIIQYNNSIAFINKVKAKKISTRSKNSSQLTLINSQSNFLNVSTINSSKVNFYEKNIFENAKFYAKNTSFINSELSQFNSIYLNSKNTAKVRLGKAISIEIKAKDKSFISFFPTEKINIERTNRVKINNNYTSKTEGINE